MSHKNFAQLETEDQRRTILEVLEQDPGYAHNANVIRRALSSVGHSVSSDKLLTELSWLQEQGMVELDEVMGLTIAKLTQRGADVAQGAVNAHGIARKGF